MDGLKGSAGSGDHGGWQGFPPEVLAAIMEVARLHGEQRRFSRPMCPRNGRQRNEEVEPALTASTATPPSSPARRASAA
jgi:hypothetical protein